MLNLSDAPFLGLTMRTLSSRAPFRPSLLALAAGLGGAGCLVNVHDGPETYETSPGGGAEEASSSPSPGGPPGGTSGTSVDGPQTTTSGSTSTSDTSVPPPDMCGSSVNAVVNPGFESEGGWSEESYVFDSLICDATCSDEPTVGSYSGSRWLWFGGTTYQDLATVSQEVSFEGGSASLAFYLSVQATTLVARDELTVSIDGDVVFTASGADADRYPVYTGIRVDLSAYADGQTHLLLFEANLSGVGETSFFIDDVSLTSCDPSPGSTGMMTTGASSETDGTGDGSGTSDGSEGGSGTEGSVSGTGEGEGSSDASGKDSTEAGEGEGTGGEESGGGSTSSGGEASTSDATESGS